MRIHWDLDRVSWPRNAYGRYARDYLTALAPDPARFVANARVRMGCLSWEGGLLPLTESTGERGNSYVCSPYTHYVDYAAEELRLLPPLARILPRLVFLVLGGVLRACQLDKTVMVNNWLISTNLYPALSDLPAAADFLVKSFPDHAVLFRSCNRRTCGAVLQVLEQQGYSPLFSRQVYFQDPSQGLLRLRQVKNDLKIYRRSGYRLVTELEDLARACRLYEDLYLEKYSRFNPQFQLPYLALMRDRRLLELRGFVSPQGSLDAFCGFFVREGVMTQPLFGYDTGLPQELGLYRLLSTQVLLEGAQNRRLIHCSAGVGPFKRGRGAVPELEYSAVHYRHLPARRRLPWRLLEQLTERIAVPLIRAGGF